MNWNFVEYRISRLFDLARCGPFVGLELIPVVENVLGTREFLIAKDMRMAKNQFLSDARRDIVDSEITAFGTDGRMKDDLQEQIAEFLTQICRIARRIRFLYGVKGLIGLFEQVLR